LKKGGFDISKSNPNERKEFEELVSNGKSLIQQLERGKDKLVFAKAEIARLSGLAPRNNFNLKGCSFVQYPIEVKNS